MFISAIIECSYWNSISLNRDHCQDIQRVQSGNYTNEDYEYLLWDLKLAEVTSDGETSCEEKLTRRKLCDKTLTAKSCGGN